MSQIDKARALEALVHAGIAIDVQKILEEFSKTDEFPKIEPDTFLLALHQEWVRKGPRLKGILPRRTVRYMTKRLVEVSGVNSGYHRLIGRLQKPRAVYEGIVKLFLTEWTQDGTQNFPHPLYDTEEKISALVSAIFWEESVVERIKQLGLDGDDLDYLKQMQQLLGRPIHLNEITSLLKLRRMVVKSPP